jgi:hypothetical protein
MSIVGRKILSMQPVGECLLEKISVLCVFYIMYIPLCIYLSLRYVFIMCLFVGYLLCMARCSFLGWFNTFLLISCVESMFLYFK